MSKISVRLAISALLAFACTLTAGRACAAPPHFTFDDMAGHVYSTALLKDHRATVFFFTSSQCPVSKLYGLRMEDLARAYGPKGVQFFAVYSDFEESRASELADAGSHRISFPIVRDVHAKLASELGADYTPEAILLDSSGKVRYTGRIDNNVVTTIVTRHDLADALDETLAGQPVLHPEEAALGCIIRRAPVARVRLAEGTPTYAGEVASILDARCVECHRTGQIAPFSLADYTQAAAWAPDIQRYTQNGYMPPWKPAPGYGSFYGDHHYVLTPHEKAVLAKWAEAGAPSGDLADTPPEPKYPSGWLLGRPDAVFRPDAPYHVAADGADVYRNFVIHTHFTRNMWVKGVEVHPGAKSVVHHVVIYIDGFRLADKEQAKSHDGQPGYVSFGGPGFPPTGLLAGWAPGNQPRFAPPGVALLIPKGANLVLQVHYHKDGKPETDQTEFGLYFAHSPVQKSATFTIAANFSFQIPPGANNYKVTGETTMTDNYHVLNVLPHMHYLGQQMKVWAALPDGTVKPLIWIPKWDFNWQETYWFRKPVALPKGTIVHLEAIYDNSTDNPFNPNRLHPKTVGWGEQTTDEMCVAFLTLTLDSQHLDVNPDAPQTASAPTGVPAASKPGS